MSQLKNLKSFLIHKRIISEKQLKEFPEYFIAKEIVKLEKSKTFTINTLIKLLNEEEKIYCECGKSLRKYDYNIKKFRITCKYCKHNKYDISKIIKDSRQNENIFNEDLFSHDMTKIHLKKIDFKKYLGSGKQRKFIKENPKLYFSILYHTKDIDKVKGINVRGRIDHILNDSAICSCGNIVNTFNNYTNKFDPVCKLCYPKKNSLDYYKLFYPKNYEEVYLNDRKKRKKSSKGIHTLKWYIDKYGDIDGTARFNMHISRMLSKQSSKSHSKISLKLFKTLVDEGYEQARFYTHPTEKMFYLDDKYSKLLNQKRIFVDFVYKNKIIEFQGDYWHKNTKEKDILRKQFLESIGYDVLFIYENEYKENNIRELNKCKRFLDDNKVQNRYKILTEDGYKDFDNVINTGKKDTIIFVLENDKIEVSTDHIFYKNKKEHKAKDLIIGQELQTKNGLQKITSISYSKSTTFDVLESENHTYYANNILNHNCEFVGSSHTLISANKLKQMKSSEVQEIRDGKLKIYEYPKEKHQYIMTVDPAKDGKDAFAIQVIDITSLPFKQVAAANLQIDYLLMPEFINEWCEFYNNPFLIIENNEGAGQSIADQMFQVFEYENLHFDKDIGRNRKKKYPGFRTTTKTRRQILQTLKLFIENDKLQINDSSTISEFFQFILVNKKYQADEGAHDDMVMALALVFSPFVNIKNFEDINAVIKTLYNDDPIDGEKVNFGDMLTIGSFDDYTDEEHINNNDFNEYNDQEYWDGQVMVNGDL